MKRSFLIAAVVLGLVLLLSVPLGVAWYFLREQRDGPTASPDPASEIEPGTGGAPLAGAGTNARATKFAELDTDQDGRLTLAEFGVERKPAEAAKWFERRDKDRDGFVSREEFLPFSAGARVQ